MKVENMKVNNPHNYEEPISDRLREIALDLKELRIDVMKLKGLNDLSCNAMKYTSTALYELAEEFEGVVDCDICGDYHDKDSVPLSCQTGDGA